MYQIRMYHTCRCTINSTAVRMYHTCRCTINSTAVLLFVYPLVGGGTVVCFQKLCIQTGKGIPCFGHIRFADLTLKPREVEHEYTRADFFFGMYQLETRFARIIIYTHNRININHIYSSRCMYEQMKRSIFITLCYWLNSPCYSVLTILPTQIPPQLASRQRLLAGRGACTPFPVQNLKDLNYGYCTVACCMHPLSIEYVLIHKRTRKFFQAKSGIPGEFGVETRTALKPSTYHPLGHLIIQSPEFVYFVQLSTDFGAF